jgi:hypothetical protein
VFKSPTCKGFVGYGDADPILSLGLASISDGQWTSVRAHELNPLAQFWGECPDSTNFLGADFVVMASAYCVVLPNHTSGPP